MSMTKRQEYIHKISNISVDKNLIFVWNRIRLAIYTIANEMNRALGHLCAHIG